MGKKKGSFTQGESTRRVLLNDASGARLIVCDETCDASACSDDFHPCLKGSRRRRRRLLEPGLALLLTE